MNNTVGKITFNKCPMCNVLNKSANVTNVVTGNETDKYQIIADTMEWKQIAKWFLLHEKLRHMDDIRRINGWLENLKDIDILDLPIDLWVEVPKPT